MAGQVPGSHLDLRLVIELLPRHLLSQHGPLLDLRVPLLSEVNRFSMVSLSDPMLQRAVLPSRTTPYMNGRSSTSMVTASRLVTRSVKFPISIKMLGPRPSKMVLLLTTRSLFYATGTCPVPMRFRSNPTVSVQW